MTSGVRSAPVPPSAFRLEDVPLPDGVTLTPKVVAILLPFLEDGWWTWDARTKDRAASDSLRLREKWGYLSTSTHTSVYVLKETDA